MKLGNLCDQESHAIYHSSDPEDFRILYLGPGNPIKIGQSL